VLYNKAFLNLKVLINRTICDFVLSASSYKISPKADDILFKYGDFTNLKMAIIRHLEFSKVENLLFPPSLHSDFASLYKISRKIRKSAAEL